MAATCLNMKIKSGAVDKAALLRHYDFEHGGMEATHWGMGDFVNSWFCIYKKNTAANG